MRKNIFESEEELKEVIDEIIGPKIPGSRISDPFMEDIVKNASERGLIKKSLDEIYAEYCATKYVFDNNNHIGNDMWVCAACKYISALENKIKVLEKQNEKPRSNI